MFEFSDPSFRKLLRRLRVLKRVEVITDTDGGLFMCKELGPYLLSLEELRHVPEVDWVMPETARCCPDPDAQEELDHFILMLRERDNDWVWSGP